jgi:hypothetical protein
LLQLPPLLGSELRPELFHPAELPVNTPPTEAEVEPGRKGSSLIAIAIRDDRFCLLQ